MATKRGRALAKARREVAVTIAVGIAVGIGLAACAAGCGDRSVAPGDAGARRDQAGGGDGALKLDAPAGAFCAGNPRAEIGSTLQAVGEIETGTTMTSCCTGEFMRFKTQGPLGPVSMELAILRLPGAAAPPLSIDLWQPPKGWSFSVTCTPYARCGSLHAGNSTLSGSLKINPLPGPPAYGATLCLKATPRAGTSGVTAIRLWGSAKINQHCVHGMDQTCNPGPISALYGVCNEDGTCTCKPSYPVNLATGKCSYPAP